MDAPTFTATVCTPVTVGISRQALGRLLSSPAAASCDLVATQCRGEVTSSLSLLVARHVRELCLAIDRPPA